VPVVNCTNNIKRYKKILTEAAKKLAFIKQICTDRKILTNELLAAVFTDDLSLCPIAVYLAHV
jgi:predicted DNA-binding protein YlxM (UPF0122 family)